MELDIVYQGRQVDRKDIAFIKDFIDNNPDKSRWFISRELCRLWNWRQQNGALKDMVCRGLLLKLDSLGLITLPPRKRITNNPFDLLSLSRLIKHPSYLILKIFNL
jgi:hypothetical protein